MAGPAAVVLLACPACTKQMRIPTDRGMLWVTCPGCRHRWAWAPKVKPQPDIAHDYYEVLQVSPNADPEVIQAALRQLAKRYHPDKNPGDAAAEEMMKLLNEATGVLCDPVRRKAYDDRRKGERAGNDREVEKDVSPAAPHGATGPKHQTRRIPKPPVKMKRESGHAEDGVISTALPKWLIAWGVTSCFAFTIGVSSFGWLWFFEAPIVSALLVAIAAAIHYSRTPCPGCDRRWAGNAWDHACKDGSPDMRFKTNRRRCASCRHIRGGW